MADITDIKSIVYTEKSLGLQEEGYIVVQTSDKVTKNQLKTILKEYFGVNPVKINSLRMKGKTKRFRGIEGKRDNYKKFYVKLPEGANIESLAV
ncbi:MULTISPECIES: 50S ribosomal protein L23 [Nitratiruptor]|uniref:Large ribosomal subunit protein uL23 n=1 Tax=Nitratiruptor tergarcus DSM 16512 TaxID=1069081 RepID=A0A1W1WRJ6_9BACT|nr:MULTISPECIES: 50S ribosomal protein L23 [Nitratiruptor]BCD61415.1 large subunit ribosomal protein L23 [Nitratiruptor sp. YY08-13]BCD65349.1 large subunit ribosomal protein L23 [Nitratiruptor sp. YY08-26]SMC08907.1 large subunit ribosomal protein L23 [Nitratiruptor tergarcus DSM 16512]